MLHLYPLLLLAVLLPLATSQAADLAYPNRFGKMAESMVDMMDAFSEAYQKRGRDNATGGTWPPAQSGGNWSMNTSPWSAMSSNPWSMGTNPWSAMTGNPWSMGTSPWSAMTGNPWSMGASPWSSMTGNPWSSGTSPWSQMPNMPAFPAFNPGASPPYGQSPMSRTAPLDGNWQGQSGEVLVVQNGRFRIYLDPDRYQEGRVELLSKDLLEMYSRDSATARRYEYAVHQGRLVLRDDAGNLLLYRRAP